MKNMIDISKLFKLKKTIHLTNDYMIIASWEALISYGVKVSLTLFEWIAISFEIILTLFVIVYISINENISGLPVMYIEPCTIIKHEYMWLCC